MMIAVILLIAGFGVAIAFVVFTRPKWIAHNSLEPPSLSTVGLASEDFIDRVLSRRDAEFVANQNSRELARLVDEERRRLALNWLHEISREFRRILAAHRISVRQQTSLQPFTELRIAFRVARFSLSYFILVALVRTAGPSRSRALMVNISARLSSFSLHTFHEVASGQVRAT